MKIQHIKKLVFSILFTFIYSTSSFAGEEVKIIAKDLTNPNAAEEVMTFLFDEGFMKMQDEQDTEVVFNSTDQNMMIISHQDQSYMIMDGQTGSAIQNEMQQAMEEALANVPPEQRAMVEQMMQQQMGNLGGMGGPQMPQMQQVETEVRETGRTDTINDYDCTYYETYRNGEKQSELCVATWSELDVSDNIQQSFTSMGEFVENLLEQFSQMMPSGSIENPFSYMEEMNGLPVYSKNFDNGVATEESTLSSITEVAFEDGTFDAPEGYVEQSIMGQ